jgi:hypothetical protein
METIEKQRKNNSPSWIRGSTQRGREFEQTHKQKVSNSSGLTATSSYPRGGVHGKSICSNQSSIKE